MQEKIFIYKEKVNFFFIDWKDLNMNVNSK